MLETAASYRGMKSFVLCSVKRTDVWYTFGEKLRELPVLSPVKGKVEILVLFNKVWLNKSERIGDVWILPCQLF